MKPFAQRVQSLKPSPTLEISAAAQKLRSEGNDVISLAAGEPDFATPQEIQQAATEAMAKGLTRYTPAGGFLVLRELLAQKISSENGFQVRPEETIITCGAKHALYLALQCLAEEGDAILLPTPAWVSYGAMIELAGAKIIPLPLFEEDGYQANVDRWKGMAIPTNAKAIILNSPNNPTGVVYSREDLIKIVGWALQRDLWIISDEVYEKITYDGTEHTSVASLGPEVKSHAITISSFSKTFSMTGWRVGWSISAPDLVRKMSALASQSTSNVTSFVQWAALTAAKMPAEQVQSMLKVFQKRRDYCVERLTALEEHLTFVKPSGAFYFFINLSPWLSKRKMTDVEFCKDLLQKHFVGLVPGSAFGKDNCVRLSYATSDDNLARAFDRISKYLNS